MDEVTDGSDVLVAIPCLNEEAHIAEVLAALRADTGLANGLIVVADGGSRDRTRDIVENIAATDPRVRFAAHPGGNAARNPSANVNRAVQLFGAGREWLVRVDAHAGYPADYASRLVATARRMDADSVVTPMVTRGTGCFQRAAAAAQNSVLGTGGSAHRSVGKGGWVDHGHHALMRLAAFRGVGGYDEAFSHNEDAELDTRLRQAGHRIWLADDLSLIYHPRSRPGALFRQYFNYGKGRAKTVARHGGKRKLRQTLPLLIAPMVALAVLTPWFWPACLPALAYALLCLGYGLKLGRGGDRCAAMAGVPAMIMHVAWSLGYWRQRLGGPSPGAFRPTTLSPA